MRIFISYSSKNRSAVTALSADLERLGHDVWFDHELTGGHVWWNDIITNIRTCDLFIAALTPQLLDSYPCQLEGRYAAALHKRILPVMLATVETALVPSSMSALQFVDYRQRNPDSVLTLSRALGNLPPERPLPQPLPTPPDVPLSPLADLRERIEASGPLSREQQIGLLLEIKGLMAQRGSAAHARVLLQRLRSRNDLLAGIGQDIDKLLQNGGRSRRTLLIVGVMALAVFIFGYEGISLLSLRRTNTPAGLPGATTVVPAITSTNTAQQVSNAVTPTTTSPTSPTHTPTDAPLKPPTDTPTTPPTIPPTTAPTTAPASATNTPNSPNVTITSEAYVSGSVIPDCTGITVDKLTLKSVIADSENMVAQVHDASGLLIYEQPITVGATPQSLTNRYAYSSSPTYSPLIFTVSSGVEILGAESLYYLASGTCSKLPRRDEPPINYPTTATLNVDYVQIAHVEPVKATDTSKSVPQSSALNIKFRHKIATIPGDQIRAGAVHMLLWVGRYADANCTVTIPTGSQLGIVSSVKDETLIVDSSDDYGYQIAYTAIDTPYIAVQALMFMPQDGKQLAHDYSATAGCFKVAAAR